MSTSQTTGTNGSPLLRLLKLNQKVSQSTEAEMIFNNIIVTDKTSPEKRRYECIPFFDMSMEDKYSFLAPEYYRAPNTISESLLLANFLESYQRQKKEEAAGLNDRLLYKDDVVPHKREPVVEIDVEGDKDKPKPSKNKLGESGPGTISPTHPAELKEGNQPVQQQQQDPPQIQVRRQARDFK